MSNRSVILLSGGLDSVVSLACTKETLNIDLALTFDYGQRSAAQEIEAAQKISDFFNINHKTINLDWLNKITNTALVNQAESLPDLGLNNLDNKEKTGSSAQKVWVPNRNGLFLNIAACFADSFSYTHIVFGANKEEATTFPDNSAEFVDKINDSLDCSTLAKPKVVAPLVKYSKVDIVKLAVEHKAPLGLIRSCYTSDEKHCGQCESCLRLIRALKETGHFEEYNFIFKI